MIFFQFYKNLAIFSFVLQFVRFNWCKEIFLMFLSKCEQFCFDFIFSREKIVIDFFDVSKESMRFICLEYLDFFLLWSSLERNASK